jgi:hypothetical protein
LDGRRDKKGRREEGWREGGRRDGEELGREEGRREGRDGEEGGGERECRVRSGGRMGVEEREGVAVGRVWLCIAVTKLTLSLQYTYTVPSINNV